MIGLEKRKAKDGEISRSARALTRDHMLALHRVCITDPQLGPAERVAGTMRYVCTSLHLN